MSAIGALVDEFTELLCVQDPNNPSQVDLFLAADNPLEVAHAQAMRQYEIEDKVSYEAWIKRCEKAVEQEARKRMRKEAK